MNSLRKLLVAGVLALFGPWAQPRPQPGPPPGAFPKTASRAPDLENASYGPNERHVLDLWKAKATQPTPLLIHIHGGGFAAGNKRQLAEDLLDQCLAAGISVASINSVPPPSCG
jgi:acetyl esterase/lipase